MHKWKYRNPYSRTCELCDRHEEFVTHVWDLWRTYNESRYGWWEVYYPLSTKKCEGLVTSWLRAHIYTIVYGFLGLFYKSKEKQYVVFPADIYIDGEHKGKTQIGKSEEWKDDE